MSDFAVEDEKDFYDTLWSTRGRTTSPPPPDSYDAIRLRLIESTLESIARRNSNLSILDLGCGTGWLTRPLARFGRAVGLDLSPHAIKRASRHDDGDRLNFLVRDFLTQPLDDLGKFDVVLASEVIEHIPNAQKPRFVEVCSRALVDRGYLFLTTPNASVWKRYWSSPITDATIWRQPVEEWVDKTVMHRLLSPHFTLLDSRSVLLNFDNRSIYRLINSVKVGRLLSALGVSSLVTSCLERAWLGLYGIYFARKS